MLITCDKKCSTVISTKRSGGSESGTQLSTGIFVVVGRRVAG